MCLQSHVKCTQNSQYQGKYQDSEEGDAGGWQPLSCSIKSAGFRGTPVPPVCASALRSGTLSQGSNPQMLLVSPPPGEKRGHEKVPTTDPTLCMRPPCCPTGRWTSPSRQRNLAAQGHHPCLRSGVRDGPRSGARVACSSQSSQSPLYPECAFSV